MQVNTLKIVCDFPFLEKEPKMLSHTSHMSDVNFILKNHKHVRGVKGKSAFCSIIDMVWGFPIDYMHNSILGVTEQLWNIWNRMVLVPSQRKEIDDLIVNIKLPRDLRRLPDKISNKSVWKAIHIGSHGCYIIAFLYCRSIYLLTC